MWFEGWQLRFINKFPPICYKTLTWNCKEKWLFHFMYILWLIPKVKQEIFGTFYSSSNYFTITENKSVFGWTSKTSFSQLISHLIGWFFPLPAYAPVQKWWVSSCETAKLTLRGIHLLLNKYLVNIFFLTYLLFKFGRVICPYWRNVYFWWNYSLWWSRQILSIMFLKSPLFY